MVAARGQDVLGGMTCRICGLNLPYHTSNCPLVTGFGQDVDPNIKDPEPVKSPTPAEESEARMAYATFNTKEDFEAILKRYCDQARAYGWEAGLRYAAGDRKLRAVYESALENPFVKPDWDKELKLPQGFQLTFKENTL